MASFNKWNIYSRWVPPRTTKNSLPQLQYDHKLYYTIECARVSLATQFFIHGRRNEKRVLLTERSSREPTNA